MNNVSNGRDTYLPAFYEYGELKPNINRLSAELNPIFHLLALLGVHHILHVSKIRVNTSN